MCDGNPVKRVRTNVKPPSTGPSALPGGEAAASGGGGDLHVTREDDTEEGTQSVNSKTKAAAGAKIRIDNMLRRRSRSAVEVLRWCCVGPRAALKHDKCLLLFQ